MYLVNDIIKLKRKIPGIRAQKVRVISVSDDELYCQGWAPLRYILGELKNGRPILWVNAEDLDAEYVMDLDDYLKVGKPKFWACNPLPV